MQIWIYQRECEVLDLVYCDGTFSDKWNKVKPVIGVCTFVDPDDSSKRLMISNALISNGAAWGIAYEASNGAYGFNSIELNDDPSYDAFDTPLPNNWNMGFTGNLSDATYRDPSTEDGFKKFDSGTEAAELGFITLNEDFSYKNMSWTAGEKMPIALYHTLIVIKHRNKVCQDSNINLQLPAASSTQTETENLTSLMDAIAQKNGNQAKYKQYYYPAVSLCHAYEPSLSSGFVLKEEFKSHNWALPTLGDLLRFAWYHLKAVGGEEEGAKLKQWMDLGLFPSLPYSSLWTINEYGRETVENVQPFTGQIRVGSMKYNTSVVLAVCAF